jgi:hypothetical protein
VAPCCACLDAKTRVLAVGALASTTCNNFIADLLFLSEVPHSLLVAGWGPLRTHTPVWACGLRPAGCGLRLAACGALRLRLRLRAAGLGRSRCGAAPAFGAGLRRKRQKAEQADRGLAPSRLGVLLDLSLSAPRRSSLVGHQPPNFLGLRRSTHFGLACGAEGRKQSKRVGG